MCHLNKILIVCSLLFYVFVVSYAQTSYVYHCTTGVDSLAVYKDLSQNSYVIYKMGTIGESERQIDSLTHANRDHGRIDNSVSRSTLTKFYDAAMTEWSMIYKNKSQPVPTVGVTFFATKDECLVRMSIWTRDLSHISFRDCAAFFEAMDNWDSLKQWDKEDVLVVRGNSRLFFPKIKK